MLLVSVLVVTRFVVPLAVTGVQLVDRGIALALPALAGCVVYLAVAWIARSAELRSLTRTFLRRKH